MQLQKITYIRIGQVYKNKEDNRIYYITDIIDDVVILFDGEEFYNFFEDSFINEFELIGFFRITHHIKDNKLAEIPRKYDFQLDDIVKDIETGKVSIVFCQSDDIENYIRCIDGKHCNIFEVHKDNIEVIGSYQATHEFINEKLVK